MPTLKKVAPAMVISAHHIADPKQRRTIGHLHPGPQRVAIVTSRVSAKAMKAVGLLTICHALLDVHPTIEGMNLHRNLEQITHPKRSVEERSQGLVMMNNDSMHIQHRQERHDLRLRCLDMQDTTLNQLMRVHLPRKYAMEEIWTALKEVTPAHRRTIVACLDPTVLPLAAISKIQQVRHVPIGAVNRWMLRQLRLCHNTLRGTLPGDQISENAHLVVWAWDVLHRACVTKVLQVQALHYLHFLAVTVAVYGV